MDLKKKGTQHTLTGASISLPRNWAKHFWFFKKKNTFIITVWLCFLSSSLVKTKVKTQVHMT